MEPASFEPPAVLDGVGIRIGVSACLVGEPVRYDSGHKRESFVADSLARYFQLVPVCPEVAIGLGVPREPIRLTGDADSPRAVGVKSGTPDATDALRAFGRRMARELADLGGYVFKSKSPSCGMERVRVYRNGTVTKTGRGLYADEIMRAHPLLPVEEEGRLNDPVLRENFIERVYAHHRWRKMLASGVTADKLVAFHTAHKLILMAHGRRELTALGRLVAGAGDGEIDSRANEYALLFMAALRRRATRKRHTDVLFHLLGYLKRGLDRGDKTEMVGLIDQYRRGLIPLIVPVTLLRHHFRRYPNPYVDTQLYLQWQPAGLSLWNSI